MAVLRRQFQIVVIIIIIIIIIIKVHVINIMYKGSFNFVLYIY